MFKQRVRKTTLEVSNCTFSQLYAKWNDNKLYRPTRQNCFGTIVGSIYPPSTESLDPPLSFFIDDLSRFWLSQPFGFSALKCFWISWFSNVLIMNVPDKDYSTNTSCALNLISTFLKEYRKDPEIVFLFLMKTDHCLITMHVQWNLSKPNLE